MASVVVLHICRENMRIVVCVETELAKQASLGGCFFLTVNEVRMLVITGQFFGDSLEPIAIDPELTGTVKKASLVSECSHLGTPALIIVSVSGRT